MSARTVVIGSGVLLASLAIGAALRAQDPQGRPAGPPPADAPKGDLFAQGGQCEACHTDAGWDRLKAPPADVFDHATTGFPLRFAHASVTCEGCHRRGLDGLTSSCSACHHDPHAGLHGMSCERCHDERTWQPARNFQAHENTRFPLTGAHAAIACEACHRPRRAEPLANTPTECEVCHARNFRRARPDHQAASFTVCGDCHTTSSFRGATYTHRVYVLDGAHAVQRCITCHTGSTFTGLASGGSDCFSCHQSDYNRTATIGGSVPNHPGTGIPTSCLGCHDNSRITWDIASIPG